MNVARNCQAFQTIERHLLDSFSLLDQPNCHLSSNLRQKKRIVMNVAASKRSLAAPNLGVQEQQPVWRAKELKQNTKNQGTPTKSGIPLRNYGIPLCTGIFPCHTNLFFFSRAATLESSDHDSRLSLGLGGEWGKTVQGAGRKNRCCWFLHNLFWRSFPEPDVMQRKKERDKRTGVKIGAPSSFNGTGNRYPNSKQGTILPQSIRTLTSE